MTRFRREPETPRAEFRIAVAGPAASMVLAFLFGVPAIVANYAGADILGLVFVLLSLSNLLLAIFNILPGYPLDGGRVLRAYLWHSGRDLSSATLTTGLAGQVIAAGLLVLGLAVMLRGQIFTGIWAGVVGLFLFDSATSIIKDVKRSRRATIDPLVQLRASLTRDMPIMHVVDRILPMNPHTRFPVAEDREVYGILVMDDLAKIERHEWHVLKVGDVMRVISEDKFVEMGTSCETADELLRINQVGALCVTDSSGKLVGFLSGRIRSNV